MILDDKKFIGKIILTLTPKQTLTFAFDSGHAAGGPFICKG